jgi:RNA polymerase sigma-70 factor (ECF subfamily)
MSSPEAPALAPTTTPTTGVDRAVIEDLIARQYAGLRLLIQRRTGDADVAADILNQAACTTWEKWQAGHVQRPEQIGGYIFQVAMNLLRNHRRSVPERPDRRVDPEVLGQLPAESASGDRWLEKKIASRVKSLLHQLPAARDREILVRFYLQEEEKEAICRDLSLDAAQFDKVLHRARARLRDLLESHGLMKSDFFMLCL